jgi:hypothetical protein
MRLSALFIFAALAAYAFGHLALDRWGIQPGTLRLDALLAAGVLGATVTASAMFGDPDRQ